MRDLTPAETEVIKHLNNAWGEFVFLPQIFQTDQDEFRNAISIAQRIVMSRPAMETFKSVPDTTPYPTRSE